MTTIKFRLLAVIVLLFLFGCTSPKKESKKSFNHTISLYVVNNEALLQLAQTTTADDSINNPFNFQLKKRILPIPIGLSFGFYVKLNEVYKVDSMLKSKQMRNYLAENIVGIFSSTPTDIPGEGNKSFLELFLVDTSSLLKFEKQNLIDVKINKDPINGKPQLAIKLDSIGTKKFTEFTTTNVKKTTTILIDDEVYMAPLIYMPITQGEIVIAGSNKKIEDLEKLFIIKKNK